MKISLIPVFVARLAGDFANVEIKRSPENSHFYQAFLICRRSRSAIPARGEGRIAPCAFDSTKVA
jgi:hypothetical protein